MNDGWIKLHRKLLDWEWCDNANAAWLFIFCLLSANHEDKKWHGIIIKQGTFISSQFHMAKKTGLSVMQIRTSLNKLKLTGELTVKTNNVYSLISIQKWKDYQLDNRQINRPITDRQQTDNRPITTNKNDKNEKNDKNKYHNLATNVAGKNINILLNAFKSINPNYEKLFANRTERKAMQEMVDKYGFEKMERLMVQLPEIVRRPYAPKIITPYELQKKMGKLLLFLEQEKNKGGGMVDATNIR